MTNRIFAALAGAVLLTTAAGPASAQSLARNDGAALAIGAGGYDVLHDQTAGIFRGEYRFGSKLWLLKPFLGGEVTTEGGTYGYGGFGLEVFLSDRWVVMPNAAVGVWGRGSGKNLGSWIEFRTGGELDYRFADLSRLGVTFHHISNAGLTRRNPGEEELLLVYSLPLSRLP